MELLRDVDFEKLRDFKQDVVGPMIHFEPIDRIVGGFRRRLIVLGGFSGSYKTTFAINIGYNNIVELGYTVAFLSLEMDAKELWKKLLLRHAQNPKFSKHRMNITCPDGMFNRLSADQQDFLYKIVGPDLRDEKQCDKPNKINYGNFIILTLEDFYNAKYNFITLFDTVRKTLSDQGLDFGIDLLIVDYLQILATFSRSSAIDKYQHVGDVIRYFKTLTQTFKNIEGEGINVIALSQINREGFKNAKENKGKYDLTSLAESSEVVNAADIVMIIHADEEDKKVKKCKIQLLKNRFGETIETPIDMFVLPEAAYIGNYRQSSKEEMDELVNSLLGVGSL